jgi:hypothetical protein
MVALYSSISTERFDALKAVSGTRLRREPDTGQTPADGPSNQDR